MPNLWRKGGQTVHISLLHPGEKPSPAIPAKPDLLYHLSLDRSLSRLCPDEVSRKVLFSVITHITADPTEITYRQQMITELLRVPALAEALSTGLTRFPVLQNAQKNAEREARGIGASRTATVTSAKNLLQNQAICCQRTLISVADLARLLDQYPLTAEGLIHLRDTCRAMAENPAHARLLHLCRKYAEFSERDLLAYRFTLTQDGRIAEYCLADRRHLHEETPPKKGFLLHTKPQFRPDVPVKTQDREGYDSFTASAFTTLAAYFSSITRELLQTFAPLIRELNFYTAALTYATALREKGVPLCFPQITPQTPTTAEGLYDLLLLTESSSCRQVIPHTVSLPTDGGLLILGENSSGKTVFLRSLATLQLLGQAGLPIPCTAASLNPCTVTALQFSHSEAKGDTNAGRFAQEVQELADMVEGLEKGAMVFLNETFQSTAYTEGAEGLCPILRHFSTCGIRWILVSHLKDLPAMLSPEEAVIYRMGTDYRIFPE